MSVQICRTSKRVWLLSMKLNEMKIQIERFLSKMTLEEKIAMIHGDALFYSGAVERLGIPAVHMSDGPMGVRNEFPRASWVPVGNTDDYVTYCISNSAVAATWNRKIAYEAGQILGEEARGRGKDMILGPGINIKRVPVNGRNFEYMSEDPYLTAELVVPMVQGIQECDVAACVKHFALNNQETNRVWVNVEIDERALREIYLPGFEAALVKGKAHALMGAYNLFRGVHCCESKELLNEILREEWGYDGVVVSDWGAVHHTRAASEASLDLEMNVTIDFDNYCLAEPLKKAIEEGEVKESDIDEKVRHLLLMMFRLKMIDAAGHPTRKAGCYNTPEHRGKVFHAAKEAIVLLKNEQALLPLKQESLKKLLVIGDNANRMHSLGGGSAEIKALYEISPLMGLKSQLGGNTQVTFAKGYYVSPKEEPDVNWQENSTKDGYGQEALKEAGSTVSEEVLAKRKALREEAVELAKRAEYVILAVGLNHDYDVEGYDRSTMELPYDQDTLISQVLAVNPNTIIVMMAGSAVSMGKWKDQAKAIVWYGYCGMEGGNALAEVLLGKVNPSGKLPESIPYCMEDSGAFALGEFPGRSLTEKEVSKMHAHTTETYKDSIYVGYRYYETYKVPVQFCFGHGLSYTDFTYSDITFVKAHAVESGENALDRVAATVYVTVTNTGNRAGKEVVQVYIGKKGSKIERALKELCGFEKVELAAGESCVAEIPLTNRAFSYYSVEEKAFTVEPGQYQIYVAKSLQDVQGIMTMEW